MGKRSRRQKKEAMSAELSTYSVPDKSPKITQGKSSYPENQVCDMKSVNSPATSDDKVGKITSYFPKSPEGRARPVDHTASAAAEKTELIAANDLLPGLGLLTPDTTPTKDNNHPLPRPAHHHCPSPLHQQPSETNDRENRPKAAQKLEYEVPVGTEEGTKDKDTAGGETGDQTKEADIKKGGKTTRRGKGRSRKSKQAKQIQSPSKTLKDYFPVRRSNRRCKSAIEAEEKKRLHDAILSGQEEGVEVQDILGKGRGVIATRAFNKGDFVVEYHGDRIDINTAKDREQEYATNPSIGCYMYYYQYRNKTYCVDATAESGRIGRLLNHSKAGNCTTKLIGINDTPYLILVAATSIATGEELVYDYGDRSKESLQSHPWLAL